MTTPETPAHIDRKNSSLMFIADTPPHVWKQDSDFHYLCLTIPGFETNDVTIHLDRYGYLVIRGEKQMTGHKYISFNETFTLPRNADIQEAAGQFIDNQIYQITIPKMKEGMVATHRINMPKEKPGSSRASIPKEEIEGWALKKKTSVGKGKGNEVIGPSVHKYESGTESNMDGTECSGLRRVLSEKCKKKNMISVGIFVLFVIIVTPIVVKMSP